MDNIEYHIKEAENKLAAAKSLFENGFYKDSASRSYYSMYHAARALLLTKDISPKTHEGLIAKFGLEFVKKDIIEKYYSKALAKGKDVREIADYGVIVEITEEEAESVIEDAEKFLERIKEAIREVDTET
ncbi:MAG: HEPN domain-containing protein [Halobacteriota archaeon]